MTEIPLFPLSSVLLPYGQMGLQIFEQRYLDLVADCMRQGSGFGVVWLRRGSEVRRRSVDTPDLGDYGTYARIIDFDQLPNGLLGITIEGHEPFDVIDVWREANGLIKAQVELGEVPAKRPMLDSWQSMSTVLKGLEAHPHVQNMGLSIDYDDAWAVALTLVQLLPLEESVKYELLGMASLDTLIRELDILLNQISGEG